MARDDFEQMRGQIHRLMGEFFKDAKPLGYRSDQCFHPPMDIYETEDDLVVVMEIAGMRTEDIHVFFEKDLLSIAGKRTEVSAAPKTRLHQMEIDYGDFERTLHIPFPLKIDEIRANYRGGFLIVTVPKRKESISKTVEVTVR
jgi:HSP20 family protein